MTDIGIEMIEQLDEDRRVYFVSTIGTRKHELIICLFYFYSGINALFEGNAFVTTQIFVLFPGFRVY
jgi:hypothetical protein